MDNLESEVRMLRRAVDNLDSRVASLEEKLLAPEERIIPSGGRGSSPMPMAAKGTD